MANEESFMLVSLEESKAKKLAQVISNDTSRKILDFLAKKDATETELSKALNIPISTVHYNLKALLDSNLVKIDEYHYSEKGKEVNHYSLANKLIIIAPKERAGLKDVLKKFLPITLISVGFAAIIQFFYSFKSSLVGVEKQAKVVEEGVVESSRFLSANDALDAVASPVVGDESVIAANTLIDSSSQIPFALWFLFGALFVVFLFILFEFVASKRKK